MATFIAAPLFSTTEECAINKYGSNDKKICGAKPFFLIFWLHMWPKEADCKLFNVYLCCASDLRERKSGEKYLSGGHLRKRTLDIY